MFAFNNSGGWKLDTDGNIEVKDGNPVYVDSTGAEKTVGGDTISKLNGEAKAHREAKEAAETKLKTYEGLDAEKAREALLTVSKLDAKTLIDAGEVDKVRDEMKTQFTEQLAEKDGKITELTKAGDNMRIEQVFSSSEFVRDDIAVPRDMFESTFRKNFKVEDGEIKAFDNNGNQLMSKERVGEHATPEESLKILVDTHSQKDQILKADGKTGSGGSDSGGMRSSSSRVTRAEFDKLPPNEQATLAGKAGKGEVTIVDS